MTRERTLQAWTAPGVGREQDARLGEREYALVEADEDGRAFVDARGAHSSELLDGIGSRASAKGTQRSLLRRSGDGRAGAAGARGGEASSMSVTRFGC
jgi:hypothetical protein